MREYSCVMSAVFSTRRIKRLYPNYPYNELDDKEYPEETFIGPGDVYFHTGKADNLLCK